MSVPGTMADVIKPARIQTAVLYVNVWKDIVVNTTNVSMSTNVMIFVAIIVNNIVEIPRAVLNVIVGVAMNLESMNGPALTSMNAGLPMVVAQTYVTIQLEPIPVFALPDTHSRLMVIHVRTLMNALQHLHAHSCATTLVEALNVAA